MLVCRWCGACFNDVSQLTEHESIHTMLDGLGGNIAREQEAPVVAGNDVQSNSERREQEATVVAGNDVQCNSEMCEHEVPVLAGNDVQCNSDRILKPENVFSCDSCSKTFRHKRSLNQHVIAAHTDQTFDCSKCGKSFKRDTYRLLHQKTCEGPGENICAQCGKRCFTSRGLKRHTDWHKKQSATRNSASSTASTSGASTHPVNKKSQQFRCRQCTTCFDSKKELLKHSMHHHGSNSAGSSRQSNVSSQQYRCRRCTACFNNRRDLYLHGTRQHYQIGGALQPRPWNEQNAPWIRGDGDEGLRHVYESNVPLILQSHRRGPIQSVYNFPLDNDVNVDQLMRYARDIYRQEQRAFRLNIVFGVILQNRETGEYRYFVPYNNNGIFERALYVSRQRDLDRLRLRLQQRDILGDILRNRIDTKWLPVLVTNVHFTVYSTYYPLGNGYLPEFLLRKDSIYPLVKSQQTGERYNDKLCAFRALALHRGYDIRHVDGPAKEFHREWQANSNNYEDGITFEDFPAFEKLFRVNLEVYCLHEDGFARSIYKSRGLQETSMYLNMYENHVSYVRDFAVYAQKYQCKTCDRHFDHAGNLNRHQKVCINQTKYVYPGGFYQSRESVFEELDRYGIHVPDDQRTFPWFACFDFEAILEKVNDQPTEFLKWSHRHVPVSFSICSNVQGHTEPVCIVNPDEDELVMKMVEILTDISVTSYEFAKEKWEWVLDEIDAKIAKDEEFENVIDFIADGEEEEKEEKPIHPLKRLYGYMESYMSQLPVIGFNSAKYDMNLIKRNIAKHLNMHSTEVKRSFVVKHNNSYVCVSTDDLKLLDMSQYLVAGSSYAGFLKAYHVEEKKGFFPYEWFDDVNKLENTTLPSHDNFYSSLKERNISAEDYEFCQDVWRNNRMSTFREFLVWYNNLDVEPFVTAVEKFQQFYFDKGIDVFKTAISVPGIARQLLFRSAKEQNVNFALFDQANADLHQTIKQNIIGGPSIIFTRHHKAHQTRIRGGKLCESILGFDANALYLQAIGKPMPVGPFVRRRAENQFRPEVRDKYMSAYYWLDWLIQRHGIPIQHKLNSGKEVIIGKYPVDGFCPAQRPGEIPTVFQFQGCYWHGHDCEITKNIKDDKWRSARQNKLERTKETTTYLEARGNRVIEMWECEFRQFCKANPEIYQFIEAQRPGFFQGHKGKITEDRILEGVVNGDLFGMVEIDIEVPDEWPSYFQHPSMTPFQYFQEMSPLFCTTDIPFEAIGEHMQTHANMYNIAKDTRRLLVGGMKAKQLLIATPLLQWYLNHGMVVNKIYQVAEFQQQRCFKEFVNEVSDARRMGDRDPNTAIIADTMKVIGNSGYGSLIMDKSKHRNIAYIQGENETCLKINDPRFRKLECLDTEGQYYELEMAKKMIKLDLPIQLGYFILQYAKLRMLQFYYDFMDVYVDRSDFEYCEMDTDSAYMAISKSSLEDAIKPEMKQKYRQGLMGFCTDTNLEADATNHWFPRTCCSNHAKYDKRTAGLFKLEFQGDEMIGLCSKTYIVRKSKTIKPSLTRVAAYKLLRRSLKLKPKRCPTKPKAVNEYKFSSKGVSKRLLTAPMTKFRRVLRTGKPQSGHNRGFRVRNNRIFTYTQERRGFSYFYCKRKVLEDGIHTAPLDITLTPVRQKEETEDSVSDQFLIEMLANNFEN